MKSITLSLLVAVGLTLGAANAFADVPATSGSVVLDTAKEASRQAELHARRATEYRFTARVEAKKAQDSMTIAISDEQHGFTYEAGVQRAKAAQHQQASQIALASAAREDAIAGQYRAQAAQATAHYKQVGASLAK